MPRVELKTVNAVSTLIMFLGFIVTCHLTALGAESGVREFRETVIPFLQRHCISCHGSEEPKAMLRLVGLNPDIANGPDVDTFNVVRLRLLAEEMPPASQPRPSRTQTRQVVRWLTKELHDAGVVLKEPEEAFLPVNGNKIDHELLFNGSISGPAATRARIWRMGPYAYEALMKGEIGKNVKGIAQPFGRLSGPGIKDYAAAFSIDEPAAGQLLRNAQAIVLSQTRGVLKEGRWFAKGYPQPVKEFVRLLEPDNQPLTEELKTRAITRQFELILKRYPSEAELSRYLALLDTTIKDAGLLEGVRTTMAAVLLTPEAVFRLEIGAGDLDKHGRRLLAPRELAFAIAYALTDRRPDAQLLRAAAENRLVSPEDVTREVTRILETEKIQKPRIIRFFREYFGYHNAPEVFKDSKLNPHHRADILVRDTERLINWILERDQHVLRELLTTTRSFVNYSYDEKRKTAKPAQPKNLVHTSYGLPLDWKWTPHQPIELPAGERAGILTQPSWLVANSSNFDNHAILRGKWIRERLLAGTVPDLPITVDAQLPEEPEQTLRQRMRVTRDEYCWNCHQRMNPLGLMFEQFDHFGRFRTFESVLDREATAKNVDSKGKSLGEVMARAALDSSGRISDSGDRQLDGEYPNAVEMLHRLARSDRVRQVFVRYAFRYWLGRNEELSDSLTLIAADRAYTESGGSFQALLISLLTSDSFRYRIAPDETVTE